MIEGRPLISYVLEALIKSNNIGNIYVALSPNVPETSEYVKKKFSGDKVRALITPGKGYVEDTAYSVNTAGLFRPFLIISSDIPLVTPDLVDMIIEKYKKCGKEALSVRARASKALEAGIRSDVVLYDTGIETVPCGINIIDGSHMDREQEEHVMIVDEPCIAVNINYDRDLDICRAFLRKRHG
jgi:adenosylcobinamide-phosphate guanylyltransferase